MVDGFWTAFLLGVLPTLVIVVLAPQLGQLLGVVDKPDGEATTLRITLVHEHSVQEGRAKAPSLPPPKVALFAPFRASEHRSATSA